MNDKQAEMRMQCYQLFGKLTPKKVKLWKTLKNLPDCDVENVLATLQMVEDCLPE